MMEYYILFMCDQWKSKSSFTFKGVFTSIGSIKNALIDLESMGEVSLDDDFEWEDFNSCFDEQELQSMFDVYIEEIDLDELN